MPEYGVTKDGFVRKRLDVIISEIQKDLTETLGFDVAHNPESLMNVIITNFSERIAKLWELGEQVYFSQYISTAEGVNLDNAGQFGGITRENNTRTAFTLVCTGDDGTYLPVGTTVASATLPKIYFTMYQGGMITRESFNKARIKVVTVNDNTSYAVTINGLLYTSLSGVRATVQSILEGLKNTIQDDSFDVRIDGSELVLTCKSAFKSNSLELSGNLTTTKVASLAMFQSQEYGKIVLPENSITDIITTLAGFDSCYNLPSISYGRLRETDIEFRQSYIKKIASRSSTMLESITSAILAAVRGVESATAYENDTNETDSEGRPPHSIEVVVDGGDDKEIAAMILRKKAGGIQTFGDVVVDVPDLYGLTIPIRFNRPQNVYVWLKVALTKNPSQAMPPNYEELIKTAILTDALALSAGDNVITQDFFGGIKELCSGLAYIDITTYGTTNSGYTPKKEDYKDKNVFITSRQKAVLADSRIEVTIDGS